ncbi:hypothetical protein GCM10010174_48730 [Kutzneria viridogrisea]|uniref:Uncharacterized protein n=1 Tax=Kutzneria viridogrisea TaxID=47990 RepID=A0ABR6BPC8_9PSEU|nr:hypothetical protein [Kutzneria viridogrisea]
MGSSWDWTLWLRDARAVDAAVLDFVRGAEAAGHLDTLELDLYVTGRQVSMSMSRRAEGTLHPVVTELWLTTAERHGALFGRVSDEWSDEQVWRLLSDPLGEQVPAVGRWPELLGWWTYFGAERAGALPPLPTGVPATVRPTAGGGAVLALLEEATALDELEFERVHRVLLDSQASRTEAASHAASNWRPPCDLP